MRGKTTSRKLESTYLIHRFLEGHLSRRLERVSFPSLGVFAADPRWGAVRVTKAHALLTIRVCQLGGY